MIHAAPPEQSQREPALEDRLAYFLQLSPTVLYAMRWDGEHWHATWVSENITERLGYTPEEALVPGWWFHNVHPDDLHGALAHNRRIVDGQPQVGEYRFRTKDGRWLWIRDEVNVGDDGQVVGSWNDVTAEHEAKQLKADLNGRLIQATKMYSLGALAGGSPELDILAYDGLIEALAAVLALIPIQFTGSIRIPAKSGSDIPKAMLLVLLFGAGPAALLIAMLVGLAQEGSWFGIVAVTVAVGWSTWSYYRLLRYAKSNTENWGWVLIALLIGALTGAAYGIVSANT